MARAPVRPCSTSMSTCWAAGPSIGPPGSPRVSLSLYGRVLRREPHGDRHQVPGEDGPVVGPRVDDLAHEPIPVPDVAAHLLVVVARDVELVLPVAVEVREDR